MAGSADAKRRILFAPNLLLICLEFSVILGFVEGDIWHEKVVLVGMLITIVFLAACNTTAEPTVVPPVELTLVATDIAFDNHRFEVKAGQPVKLTLQNDGVLEHDFNIMKIPHTGAIIATKMGADEMVGHDMSHMSVEPDVHVAAPIGMSNTVEFTPSEPGGYEFLCTLSGHKEAGMVGTLVVTAP